jgi:hypothetical protein
VEVRRPGVWMGTLDPGSGESGIERCLDSSSVGQKSPVEIQHAQEAPELTGGLRRRTAMQICHSFLQ